MAALAVVSGVATLCKYAVKLVKVDSCGTWSVVLTENIMLGIQGVKDPLCLKSVAVRPWRFGYASVCAPVVQ